MFKDPFQWFPDPYFSTILAVLALGAFFIDYWTTKNLNPNQTNRHNPTRDHGSFRIIQICGFLSVTLTLICRYGNMLITPVIMQYLGLLLICAGSVLREWAILKLGRFFSHTVQVQANHQIITEGPYRWIRHPAYTGMLLMYLGIAFAIGTWLGVFMTAGLMLGATMYRISIEEKALIDSIGGPYNEYIKYTWRLFPGW